MTTETQRRKKSRRGQRGQSMVEYSIINYVLIAGLVFLSSAPVFEFKSSVPGGEVTNRNVIEMMLDAYQRYYDSFYLVLMMPYP